MIENNKNTRKVSVAPSASEKSGVKPFTIELLAPAKNLECGIEAIKHGADAVYIGAPKYGARAAAGNSIDDLRQLAAYAHRFGAKVYVTLNTIIYDDELAEVESLVWQLYRIGIDALIVQDMALLTMNLPPIELHASTQTDNRTPEKVKFLYENGFSQVVLARELSLDEISAIHRACPVPLETFVHGALCVSYSGQCYASQACFGRSANRGECAQFCRLPFDLVDADGRIIERNRHLLSLKDMNRSAHLEAMMDAGVRSFKIEGRLKDVSYVKNVTACYRQAIDAILARRPEYTRSSQGVSTYTFTPQLDKSFNRGFTDYFITGKRSEVYSFATPKAVGEPVGHVKEVGRGYIAVSSTQAFHNGDGLCYIDDQGQLQGFRVNRVEGTRLYPKDMPRTLRARTPLFRNYDQEFERLLSRPSAERRIPVDIYLCDIPFGFSLTLTDEQGGCTTVNFTREKELARTEQRIGIEAQLTKLGGTILIANRVEVDLTENWFIPSSVVADMRRVAVEAYERMRRASSTTLLSSKRAVPTRDAKSPFVADNKGGLTYLANIANRRAADFYRSCGAEKIAPAYELESPRGATLMFCRHCLRYAMGWCPQRGGKQSPYREPYTLVSVDGKRFALTFDCKQCMMMVKEK
ncbi:MAG: U32 family peptidase [Bacteroidaceae bacterium]|nr:U32 family peptidase [Bacteroidaceae bacterium]